jgi:hypothetical protein
MWEMRDSYKMLVGKPEGKRLPGRTRHRWEDSIKICLGEIGWEVVDWIHLAQDRYEWWAPVNMIIYLWILYKRQGMLWVAE